MDKKNKPGVTDGCLVLVVPLVLLVFAGTSVFGMIIGMPLTFATSATLGTAFVLVFIMLGIEVLTGIFHIEPPDNERKTP